MSTLALREVELRRGGRTLLSRVSFEAHPGDLIAAFRSA